MGINSTRVISFESQEKSIRRWKSLGSVSLNWWHINLGSRWVESTVSIGIQEVEFHNFGNSWISEIQSACRSKISISGSDGYHWRYHLEFLGARMEEFKLSSVSLFSGQGFIFQMAIYGSKKSHSPSKFWFGAINSQSTKGGIALTAIQKFASPK
jgi:hypothetical protein